MREFHHYLNNAITIQAEQESYKDSLEHFIEDCLALGIVLPSNLFDTFFVYISERGIDNVSPQGEHSEGARGRWPLAEALIDRCSEFVVLNKLRDANLVTKESVEKGIQGAAFLKLQRDVDWRYIRALQQGATAEAQRLAVYAESIRDYTNTIDLESMTQEELQAFRPVFPELS